MDIQELSNHVFFRLELLTEVKNWLDGSDFFCGAVFLIVTARPLRYPLKLFTCLVMKAVGGNRENHSRACSIFVGREVHLLNCCGHFVNILAMF